VPPIDVKNYIMYRIFSNLIRTSFYRFLKRGGKKTVRGSNPHLSFNRLQKLAVGVGYMESQPRRFVFGKFVRKPNCSLSEAFVNEGLTVLNVHNAGVLFGLVQSLRWAPKPSRNGPTHFIIVFQQPFPNYVLWNTVFHKKGRQIRMSS